MRREAGREAHVSPTAWGLEHLERLADLREERHEAVQEARAARTVDPVYLTSRPYLAREDNEHREDTAVHLAVTVWALHQQSLRDDAMHQPGWTLGRAVRRLAHKGSAPRTTADPGDTKTGRAQASGGGAEGSGAVEEVSETVRRRFVRVGTAPDTEVLATRLRELVLLLRTARIPLDYALLADQLLWWQDENLRDTVRRTWGRDFHRRYRPAVDDAEEGAAGLPDSSESPDSMALDPEEFDGDS
ncbi:type I-E CRISPR-associated protein Cse2/CasB [Streptomyces sp. LaPpAH-108]|uniref:type I-E CRISPR-associated protein Cse2/CasB n=1 Tax=Streptomyces sp. LaPpAH-108 TaxID=1155714 RepID=UPI001F32ADEA|nr:type I-E CRISPR-associated protein Cse2/CasB [Streptomyces sp. LaPpAH-108]